MNHDALFFARLLQEREPSNLRLVRREDLDAGWQAVYDFILEHTRQHQALPHVETVEMSCRVLLGQAPENLTFYAARVRENAMRRVMEEGFTEKVVTPLAGLEAEKALEGAASVVSQVRREFRQEASTALDYGSNIDVRLADYELRARAGDVLGLPTRFATLTHATGGYLPGEAWCIAGRPNMGKAQPLDSSVLTPDGWQRFGDLRVGDRLASVDGLPSEVTAIHPQGTRVVYSVEFSDGRKAEACADHLWHVHYRHWDAPRNLTTIEVADLLRRKRYRGRIWIDRFTGDYGDVTPLPIDPWLMGVLLGDGCFRDHTLSFTSVDEHIVGRARALVRGGVRVRPAADGKTYYLSTPRGQANPMLDTVRDLGLHGLLATDKFIPDIYLRACRSQRVALLAGLMDTDGEVAAGGTAIYSTSSARLMEGVVYLARSLGAEVRVSSRIPNYTRKDGREAARAYRVTIRHERAYEWVTLPRKQVRFGDVAKRKMPRLCFKRIRQTGEVAEMQCITVSHPSRLYITDDFVVTHNSWLSQIEAVTLYQRGARVLLVSMETPPQNRLPRNEAHRVVRDQCLRCRLPGVSADQPCPAAKVNRQRLTVRLDALGAGVSAWRLLKGTLTPREKERWHAYMDVIRDPNCAGYGWGDLRIVAPPDIRNLADLELEVMSWQPDIVIWDSAYLGVEFTAGMKRKDAYDELLIGFKLMLEREGIPGLLTWHLKREVTEKATSAGLGDTAYTDELGRLLDVVLGLFRPPDRQQAREAVLRTLKVRDGIRMPELILGWGIKDKGSIWEISAEETTKEAA